MMYLVNIIWPMPQRPCLVAVRKDRRRVEVLRDASRQLRTFNRAWSSASDGPLVKRLSRCGSVFAHSRNSTSLVL